MATTERKRSVSSRIAAATPISSPIGADCSSPMSIAMPRIETSTPACSAGPVTDSRRSRAAGPRSSAGTSYWTVANATLPSGETCGVAHAGHVWLPVDGLQRGLDAVAGHGRRITGEDDLGVGARDLREALLEQLLGARRVDARRAVVVDEAGAEGAAERADAGDHDDRDEQGAAPVAG